MACEEEKTPLQELFEAVTVLSSLSPDDYKKAGLSYFDSFRDLFIFHLTESLWVYVIAKTEEPLRMKKTPSLIDTIKSSVGQSSDGQSSDVSIQTFSDSVKENVIFKPFSLILQKVLGILQDDVQRLKAEYETSKNDNIKTKLENAVSTAIRGMPEVIELRKQIEQMMGGKRKRKRTRRRRKRRKTKRSYKGGNLTADEMSGWIEKVCVKEVNQKFN